MLVRLPPVAALFLAVLPGVAFGQTGGGEPIRTTVCELVKEPAKFNGKIVQVRANLSASDEAAALYDQSCSALILFTVNFIRANSANQKEEHTLSASLKKYQIVIATLIGRFDHADARQFGHQNMFDSRFVAQSISDVYAKQVERSSYHPAILRGTVVDRTDALIVNASVKLYRRGRSLVVYSARTDTDGTFCFAALEPDTYTVVFDAPGFRSKRIKNIFLPNASNVELPPTKLENLGIVLDNPPG